MSWTAVRLAAAALFAAALAPQARAGAKGVTWETTFSIEMEGMAMPAQTQRICVAEGSEPEPPAGPDDDCRVKDVKRSGSRMTWKVVCTGKDPMTGEGDMTYGADAWKGNVTLRSEDGPMKMAMRGKKLGGRCDAASMATAAGRSKDIDRQVADAQRQVQDATARAQVASCDSAVQTMSISQLTGKDSSCQDRSALGRLCARVETRDGFSQLASHEEGNRRAAATSCKRDLQKVQRNLCGGATADAPEKDAVDFLGRFCKDEVQRLAKRECAGRDFTGLDREWVPFCSKYGRELMAAEGAKKEGKDAAVNAGKKALKGLFGF